MSNKTGTETADRHLEQEADANAEGFPFCRPNLFCSITTFYM